MKTRANTTQRRDNIIKTVFSCPSLENLLNFQKVIEPVIINAYGNENVLDFNKLYWSESHQSRAMCVFINLNGKSKPTQERKGKCQ